uniref:(S)-ureidoglycine aminohydrolase cupin domain-containing protein n=1 Tax=Odontella aurita TaxID=265563 RepID=A0A7S4K5Y9_9STRA|mmetsp:Transcript_62370/g.184554  ORF Transcript_62370/g.184554 Transcript_62370/m.184554 type:complete len:319 (+) Transcript_62370:124-1080(+)
MKNQSVLAVSLLSGACAFAPAPIRAMRSDGTHLASSYLDGLTGASAAAAPSAPTYAAPDAPMPAAAEAEDGASGSFSYAPLSYFSTDRMVSKGPRETKDWGTPQDATRKLDDDGTFRVGAWYCTEGGWPSPNPKAHTEVFYVVEGHGCLGDSDGARHYFGPGDTVIIPKGHTGRWDVHSPIHKVWAVNDHDRIEETSDPIRAVVENYHGFAPHRMTTTTTDGEPLYGMADAGTARTFYDVGPTKVGAWTCDAGSSFPVGNLGGKRFYFTVLEGVVFVTDSRDGSARRCVPGDTVMLRAGFEGHIDVMETAKKVWTLAE